MLRLLSFLTLALLKQTGIKNLTEMFLQTHRRRKNSSCWLTVPETVPVAVPVTVPETVPKNPCFDENHILRYEGFVENPGELSDAPCLYFAALLLLLTFLRKNRYTRNLSLFTRNLLPPAQKSADAVPFPLIG